jgi:hypothetical protein
MVSAVLSPYIGMSLNEYIRPSFWLTVELRSDCLLIARNLSLRESSFIDAEETARIFNFPLASCWHRVCNFLSA